MGFLEWLVVGGVVIVLGFASNNKIKHKNVSLILKLNKEGKKDGS